MPTVPLRDGEQLNVLRMGRGKPVLLLHGFGTRAWQWLPNILPHTRKFEFFLPDLRGFGASHQANLDGLSVFETYAHDIEDILNYFELDEVILGGFSTGAYSCLTYNKLYGFSRINRYLNIEHGPNSNHCPGKQNGLFRDQQSALFTEFQKLVEVAERVGTEARYWDLSPAERIQFRETFLNVIVKAVDRRVSRLVVSSAIRRAERLCTQLWMPIDRWQTYLRVMQAFMEGGDTRCALANIQVPTTVMIGRNSEFFDCESQQEIATHVPNSKVIVFENSGHTVMADQPIKFQREFGAFLNA